MRHWIAVLLLVLLPVQFSWAAVADYCGHSTAAVVTHEGQHEHASHGAGPQGADAAEASTPATAATACADCAHCLGSCHGHCHGHCVGLLNLPGALQPLVLSSAAPRLIAAGFAEPQPALPDRPQWAGLA